ncbi:MAG: protein-disulfide reductase DsbD [Thiothrix sp.]|nr:MAG: protein-disulfide reductase DsbD [Thiothrix sp.]
MKQLVCFGWVRIVWICVLFALPLTVSQANKLFPFDTNSFNQTTAQQGDPLPPEQAFALNPPLFDGKQLLLRWDLPEAKFYLYKEKFKVRVLNPELKVGELQLPAGEAKHDEFFGDVHVLHHSAELKLPIDLTGKTSGNLQVEVGWQGCDGDLGVCYPPELKYYSASIPTDPAKLAQGFILEPSEAPITGTVANPSQAAATNLPPAVIKPEQDQIADTLAYGNWALTLLSFFGFGLLLSFTPCIFPMIPILSGIIAGQKNLSTRGAFLLSLVYVLAMAATYTVAGVLAGLFGSNLQILFQNPWILGMFSAVFVLLALSMFGFYELQMPAAFQQRLTDLSNQQAGGNLIGVAIMGALSALIVGPCVAAPLAGALIYIGQSGDALLGGAALFMLSIGMGIPLLIIGTSAGKFLPRAGAWMESVKAVFGVMLLGVALTLLERILPEMVSMFLWAALLIIAAIYMGALTALPPNSTGWRTLWKGLAVLLFIQGSLVAIGAAAGSTNLIQPLKGVFNGEQANELSFRSVNSISELNQAVIDAKGKPVLFDFYADWCVSCREMDKYTFSDPNVKTALKDFVLLRTDLSSITKAHRELLAQFNLYGPPGIILFDTQGQERKNLRVVGFMRAEPFAKHVSQIQAP